MKIRNGFVSNSSSSSFCIIGMSFNEDSLKDYLFKTYNIDEDKFENEYYGDKVELINKLAKDKNLNIYAELGLGEYDEEILIGMSYYDMKNDETKLQFHSRILKELEELLPGDKYKFEINIHYDAGYDG